MIPQAASDNAPEWTVSELAGALRRTLEDRFGHVRVRGEIIGYKGPHASGHSYLCLKDRDARIDGVIWKSAYARLKFKPQEGLEVVATGRITTFPGKSTYQIVIEQLEPAGAGALMALLEQRRRALAAEGLFAAERKRRIPFLPGVIGIVTSPTGAVIRDILHRLSDRFPRRVLLWPVRVQGETCGGEVAAAIAGFNALGPGGPVPRPDVVIVARGGGSLEDLWGFNDEAVVREAAAGTIPLVSAIGHETDWTLLDHAADLRAPTPTGAAEMVVPVRSELVAQLAGIGSRSTGSIRRGLEAARTELRSASRAMPGPEAILQARRQPLDLLAARLAPALLANARDHEARWRAAGDRLARATPRLALATARARLDAVGTKPATALRRSIAESRASAGSLAGRLRVGRDASLHAERLRLARCRERLADVSGRATQAVHASRRQLAARLEALGGLLSSLGYRSVLERGYALVRSPGGRPVARAADLLPGEAIEIEFADGRRGAQADGTRRDGGLRAARKPAPLAQASLFDI